MAFLPGWGRHGKTRLPQRRRPRRSAQRAPRIMRNTRRRPIRPTHRNNTRSNFAFSIGPLFEVAVKRNLRRAVRNQTVIRFEGASNGQLRFHFAIGEVETAETAVQRQERIREHRIIFVPSLSTNTNNREEGMCLATQVPESEFGSDTAGAA